MELTFETSEERLIAVSFGMLAALALAASGKSVIDDKELVENATCELIETLGARSADLVHPGVVHVVTLAFWAYHPHIERLTWEEAISLADSAMYAMMRMNDWDPEMVRRVATLVTESIIRENRVTMH